MIDTTTDTGYMQRAENFLPEPIDRNWIVMALFYVLVVVALYLILTYA